MKPNILIFCDYYLPGYKAGGPIRSLSRIVLALSDEFGFRIATRDRDLGDTGPYPLVARDSWQTLGKAQVIYSSPKKLGPIHLRRLLLSANCSAVYLNSVCSVPFSIWILLLRRLRLIPKIGFILAPRGELSGNALQIKRFKKDLFLTLAKMFGLFKGIIWHASSEHEKEDIQRKMGRGACVVKAGAFPNLSSGEEVLADLKPRAPKESRKLKVVFLSRISKMKNLDGALRILQNVKGIVDFHIYGNLEDKDYWNECKELMARLPSNVTVNYHGPVKPEEVKAVLRQHDLFFLPTRGENYGHVIVEALSVGCPVLISDRTAWRGLEDKKVGWDLPLENPGAFVNSLERLITMSPEDFALMTPSIHNFVHLEIANGGHLEQTRDLFRKALASA